MPWTFHGPSYDNTTCEIAEGSSVSPVRAFKVSYSGMRYDGMEFDAATVAGLPVIGTPHPRFSRATCLSRMARPFSGDDPKLWLVTAKYGIQARSSCGANQENPLLEPQVTRYTGTLRERETELDLDGQRYANSAGHAFETPLIRPAPVGTITIMRNEAAQFHPVLRWAQYQAHTNSDALLGGWIEPGWAFVRDISADQKFTDDQCNYYWAYTYTVDVDPDGWKEKRIDKGWAYKDDEGRTLIVKDDTGNLAAWQTFLDGNGGLLQDGVDPVELEFRVLGETDLAALLNLS